MSTLRSRRHSQTRSEIVDAAFTLFAERGYANVTMEEIAAAAGISRSTVYRRFPTKEDVVLDVPTRWLEAFDEAAATLGPDTTLAQAFSVTSNAVATYIDANIERAVASYAILEEAPTLKVSGVATGEWLGRMVELAEKYGGGDRADDRDRSGDHEERSAIIAGAYLGGIDATMFRWAANGGTESVVAATARLHRYLEPLLQ